MILDSALINHVNKKLKIDWDTFEHWIVLVFISIYSLAAIFVSLHRFWQYDAFWYDFGILDETIWRLSRFTLPIIPTLSPPSGALVWGDHFNPTLVLLSPIYWLTDRAEVMLVTQVVIVALSSIVAYSIARATVKNSLGRIALVVSYLGYVGMQNALYTDIHNVVFATLPLMLTFWALYEKRWRLYWLFLFLTLGVQENMAGVGVGIGLFLFLKGPSLYKDGPWQKVALTTIIVSLVWGTVVTRWIMPALSGHSYPYTAEIPTSASQWITSFFIPVDMKLRTIALTILTFGVLPIFSLPILPLFIFHFLERFVFNQAATRWDLGFHYNALLSTIMFVGGVEVVSRIERIRGMRRISGLRGVLQLWAIGTIGIVIFLHRFYLHGPLLLATHPVFYQQTKRAVFLENFVKQIPRDGLLMTQNNLAAHFTHDRVVLLSKNFERLAPDFVAVDIRAGQNANNFFPLTPFDFEQLVASLSASPNYQKKLFREDQLLFVRK